MKRLVFHFLRVLLRSWRRSVHFVKRHTVMGYDVDIHPSVAIAWSAQIDLARGRLRIGRATGIDQGVVLRAYGGAIEIGENVTLNPYCVILGEGGVRIGNGVRIASHTVLAAQNHNFQDTDTPIHEQGSNSEGIVIEDDVWLGAGVRVTDGVTIARGTVVGAGAVVTKSTEAYSIVAGVPARKVSSRLSP